MVNTQMYYCLTKAGGSGGKLKLNLINILRFTLFYEFCSTIDTYCNHSIIQNYELK